MHRWFTSSSIQPARASRNNSYVSECKSLLKGCDKYVSAKIMNQAVLSPAVPLAISARNVSVAICLVLVKSPSVLRLRLKGFCRRIDAMNWAVPTVSSGSWNLNSLNWWCFLWVLCYLLCSRMDLTWRLKQNSRKCSLSRRACWGSSPWAVEWRESLWH